MRFLIDGDVYVYHACFAAQKEVTFGRTVTKITDLDELHRRLETTIVGHMKQVHRALKLRKKAETTVMLSGVRDENWRKAVYAPYKGNRRPSDRPLGFAHALDWIRNRWKVEEVSNLEADDLLGIRATEVEKAVIFTTDKDLLQIPRIVARPSDFLPGATNGEMEIRRVTEEEGAQWHLVQALTGDQVDNYPGLPGVGQKTAEKILAGKTGREAWDAIVAAYEKKGKTEEDALAQARVARMLRTGEFDFDTKEVKLWLPS